MNGRPDSELLRDYAEHHSEAAFGELARRHVDLVFSAARRMVCDAHLAEDVTQAAFIALAKNAAQLTDRPVLSAWLHRTAQNIAAQTVRTDVRRRAREREAAAVNQLLTSESDPPWVQIAPHLDAALNELTEPDRDALLLRYFEGKSAREMARILSTSEEAAQKRVSRAVERLREVFAKGGVTVGASGLAVLISANAVEAAPAGLATTVSSAGVIAGKAVALSTTKVIAMTTLQKGLLAAIVAAAALVGVLEVRHRTPGTTQVAIPDHPQSQDELTELQGKLARLGAENAELANALAQANADKARLMAEREQAKRAAALFKELADQANSRETNATNEYPTARHALRGFGRLAQRYARLKEQDEADLSDEEQAAAEELRLNLVVDTLQLTKLAKQFGLYPPPQSPSTNTDSADYAACFLLGALDLNEEQFSGVYDVMQKYRQPAVQPIAEGDDPPPGTEELLKYLEAEARQGIQNILSEKQARVFSLISPNLHLINPTDGRASFGYTLGEEDTE